MKSLKTFHTNKTPKIAPSYQNNHKQFESKAPKSNPLPLLYHTFVKKSIVKLIIALILGILPLLSPTISAFAAPDSVELDFFDVNKIYYYDPSGDEGEDCVTSMGNNTNYKGEQVLTDAQMQLLEANKPFYEKSAEKYQIPWQILAAIHYREFGLNRNNPGNGDGPYQILSSNHPPGLNSDADFQAATDEAAAFVVNLLGGRDVSDPNVVKSIFFAYNGTASTYINKAIAMGFSQEEAHNGEGSFYVMNRYDEQRDPTSPKMSPLWPGRYVADYTYDPSSVEYNFGAYTVFAALGGEEGRVICSGGSGGGNQDINATAIELAWPDRTHAISDPNPAYRKALSTVPFGGICGGASCDVYVATVLHYSGADKDVPCCGVCSMLPYFANSSKYEEIQNLGNTSNLQPGDVLINCHGAGTETEHIELLVKLDNGGADSFRIASASYCKANGARTADYAIPYYHNAADGYRVFRLKK